MTPTTTPLTFSPTFHAHKTPLHSALILGDDVLTYEQLDLASSRLANIFRTEGLRRGDHVAFLSGPTSQYPVLAWGAQRAGLYFTAIDSRLSGPEIEYILNDSQARAVIASHALAERFADHLRELPLIQLRLSIGGRASGFASYDDALLASPSEYGGVEWEGSEMLYSSGTTGRPKGVWKPMADRHFGSGTATTTLLADRFGMGEDTVYLCPAPQYHATPLIISMTVQRLGGTVIAMDRFDPESSLEIIEKHGVTHASWVPTMFVRMLRLDDSIRTKYDLSSLRKAIHSAAPCPPPVKQAMIDWWGPILEEYYGGTEGNGHTFISTPEWLTHRGSVGRPMHGAVHIVDDAGREKGPDEIGGVYFEGGGSFEYFNDPAKTAASRLDSGWTTLGDVGYKDHDGYLYLSDRRSDLIVSGGVNIYPQEVENALLTLSPVADAAVFGVPDDEWGQHVVAAVQLSPGLEPTPDMETEIQRDLRKKLASFKCPKELRFVAELPRTETGKLVRRALRDSHSMDEDQGGLT